MGLFVMYTFPAHLVTHEASCYSWHMNKQITRVIAGVGIVTVGVLALLNAIGVVAVGDIFRDLWPSAIILAGILIFINQPREFVWPLIIVTAGMLLQLRELDIVTFNVWQLFWPIVIIAIGLSVLINRSYTHSKNTNKKDLDEIAVLLAGSTTKNESKDYKGGKVSAVFGGAELDLRNAAIKDEAILNVFVLFGGVEIKVPEGWAVKSTVTPVAGGVDIKTKETDKKAPVLTITGDVAFGGLEIKH